MKKNIKENTEITTDELLQMLKSKHSFSQYKEMELQFLDYTLNEYLAILLDRKQLEKSEVIRLSGLDRTYGYQIFSGLKSPSRNKLLAIIFGMKLTLEEAQTLLKITSFPILYPKKHRDSIILFCLAKGIDLLGVNELLYESGEEIIE